MTPNRSPILAQESPCERRAAILAASTTLGGRPSRLPLAFAFRRPALTRSAIRLRWTRRRAPATALAHGADGTPSEQRGQTSRRLLRQSAACAHRPSAG